MEFAIQQNGCWLNNLQKTRLPTIKGLIVTESRDLDNIIIPHERINMHRFNAQQLATLLFLRERGSLALFRFLLYVCAWCSKMEKSRLYDLYGQVLGASVIEKWNRLPEKRADLHEEEEFGNAMMSSHNNKKKRDFDGGVSVSCELILFC